MIRITTNAKSVANWVKHLKTNIERSQTKIAKSVTESAKFQVEVNAPEWRGTLRSRVAMKIFPQSHRGEVFMASPLFNMIALENEFNISGQRRLYKSSYPKLAEWAAEKGVFSNFPYVIVGGKGTRLGRQNRFFYPAFINVQAEIPIIVSGIIAEAIMKTKG